MLRIRMAAGPIRPGMALKPKGWMKAGNMGMTPSGAVSRAMAIVGKERTCSMMKISMAAIMTGKILPGVVSALTASSIDPPMSMRWPAGSDAISG